MRLLIAWLTDIYRRHGYRAALIALAVLASIAAGAMLALDVSPADFVRWLGTI